MELRHTIQFACERDQADAAGPFAWCNPPRVAIRQWISDATADYLDAECCYRDCRHRRQSLFLKSGLLFILDQVECGNDNGSPWLGEQFWHPGASVDRESRECFRINTTPTAGMLVLDGSDDAPELVEGGDFGWKSPVFGVKEATTAIVRRRLGQGTLWFGAVVIFSAPPTPCLLTLACVKDEVEMSLSGGLNESVVFHPTGRHIAL